MMHDDTIKAIDTAIQRNNELIEFLTVSKDGLTVKMTPHTFNICERFGWQKIDEPTGAKPRKTPQTHRDKV